MSKIQDLCEYLRSQLPQFACESEKRSIILQDTEHEIEWKIDMGTQNRFVLSRLGHFYMRTKASWEALAELITVEHDKTMQQDEIRKIGGAICEYIETDGLPDDYRVINTTSNLSGGIMSIMTPNGERVMIKTMIDPPVIKVEHSVCSQEFQLNDPDCAKSVAEYVALCD